ncbi:cytoplasmic protein [Cryptococcus neoformans C23]|uniref:Cytoplasmic protein n=2 Tax=Cryptococcus neoformans TaxID=5207 RepID=A0A854QGV9_CRYNE|nr:cytoplasmic protein [Cryptococcus neoformans var. grubii H99]AUB29319.1 cytoplasmic protein [Cryptococcus neoformans var. grubii]OWZ25857.1 cytoplasmic protein [Cryptococcus neoformans var. grubii AD1-83a]OWZ26031.1 cytoplasmic protein [Cryptococcus neoformans var. grubii AD2-60a]OWZ38060.1 cytoplasmic protein [Cryptococcus neoformans var. grubii C23]OWZ49802.1 cytoplasmic protein [Cryptococcus neoformans var. grubii 125.91]OWZ74709.1 cytoplasmic protein [Cryptococcus neoformans var. grubi|eukprot:XP_012053913.1 cytoplasmic protein [Cryptococcus neoformans var. grubii H99]
MPITLDFTGKLVLVTGGGRGIGLAISKALAEAGADVAISYTSKDATPVAKELSDKHGTKVRAFKCEITKSSEVDALVEEVKKEYGKDVDIGVANAGISLWKDAHENTDEDFQSIFAVNTFGPYYLSRALVRSWLGLPVSVNSVSDPIDVANAKNVNLKKQILFVSSISALVAMNPQRQTAYNASKGAVTMLAKSLAGEWSHIGVAVNSISPGYVSTDMIANPPDATASTWVKEWEKRTPVGRFATADEIGGFVATLLSDKMGGMGFMAGSDIVVDGGYTIF